MPRSIANVRSQIRYVARALGGFPVIINLVSVLALAAAVAGPGTTLGSASVLLAAALIMGRAVTQAAQDKKQGKNPRLWIGNSIVARVAVTAGALALGMGHGEDGWTVTAAVILLVLLIGEQTVRRPLGSAVPHAANLRGADIALPSTPLATSIFVVNTAGTTLLALAGAFDVTPLPAVAAGAAGTVLLVTIGLHAVRFLVQRRRVEAALPSLLKDLAPAFVFHWQAPAGTAYQAAMWLPYLERIGTPYFVLVRTMANFHEVSKMTTAPVILRSGLEDLDRVITPSLRAVFYANTAVRNSHMIRFPHLVHIQLNHGDSDKIASVSPTFRQYDRNFVAGQAAIDRFATHGVAVLPDQFEIVGRPQLEDVRPPRAPIGSLEQPVVLYSPTWSGFYDDSDYSSLSAGPDIVRTLLDTSCSVLFRPHPYADRHPGNTRACAEIIAMLEADARATGRPHVFGARAESEMTVVDCFNASDAMISDVSSLSSDYLMSGKPFAMAAVSAHGEAFTQGFPLSRAAYVFDVQKRSAPGLADVVRDMLGPDSQAGTRASMRAYYLSDTPPEQIAERFLETARRYLR